MMIRINRSMVLGAVASALGFGFAANTTARAALAPGDVAVIGFIDNGSPDSFAFVNLAPIDAGQDVYFTDNGWINATGAFRSGSSTDGDGNENLIKFTANNAIPAGTIIRSSDTGAAFTWTTSGAVPGGTSGAFAPLSLGQGGEQIYAFTGPTNLPLQNPQTHLFVLDDTNGFEDATDSSSGNVPPGLTLGSTALTFNFAAGDFVAVKSSVLAGAGKSKADWLAAFSDPANWDSVASGTLPTGSINVVPEPAMLGLCALSLGAFANRRRRAK